MWLWILELIIKNLLSAQTNKFANQNDAEDNALKFKLFKINKFVAKSARTKEHVQERAVFVIDNSIFSIFDIINLTKTHTTHSGVCRSEVNHLYGNFVLLLDVFFIKSAGNWQNTLTSKKEIIIKNKNPQTVWKSSAAIDGN